MQAHEYAQTVAFYRDVLGFPPAPNGTPDSTESVRFRFGDKLLWIDRVFSLSQAEVWLEVVADDVEAAAGYLEEHGCARRDEIEALTAGFRGSGPRVPPTSFTS